MYSFKPFHIYYTKYLPFSQIRISPIESQTSSLLKYKGFYVDGNSKTIKNYTKELF